MLKLYLLQEESKKYLYQRTLSEYLDKKSTYDNIDIEFRNIEKLIKQASTWGFGKMKGYRKKFSLKIRNAEIKNAIKQNHNACIANVQVNSEKNRSKFIEGRNYSINR